MEELIMNIASTSSDASSTPATNEDAATTPASGERKVEREELETWEASSHNFPILDQLVFVSCDKLNSVPFEKANIPNLYEMRLENTIKAVKSAKDIVEYKMISQNKNSISAYSPRNRIHGHTVKLKGENLDVELP